MGHGKATVMATAARASADPSVATTTRNPLARFIVPELYAGSRLGSSTQGSGDGHSTPPGTSRPLRRALGVWRVSLTGIGIILGAGVYALVGPAARESGNAMWLAFLLAGVTAGLTAYTYARLVK